MIERSRLAALAVRVGRVALRAPYSISRFAAGLRSRWDSGSISRLSSLRLGLRPRPAPFRRPPQSVSVLKSAVPGLVAALGLAVALGGCGGDEPVTEPRPISAESPFRYPIEQWDAGAEGQVVLMVHVTDVGGVDSVYVLNSSGEPALDTAALDGARELEFAPGRRGEDRIAMWAKLPVYFTKPDSMRPGGSQ